MSFLLMRYSKLISKKMKLKEKAQIKLNNSFEDASRIVEKLKSLGFNGGYNTTKEWWYAVFIKDRMNLTIFDNGYMSIANHEIPSYSFYDSLDEFLNPIETKSLLTGKAKEDFDKWWGNNYENALKLYWLCGCGINISVRKAGDMYRPKLNGSYVYGIDGIMEFKDINDALDALVRIGNATYNEMHK